MKKIGLAIALGQDATLHTQTFLQAVGLAHYALTQGSQRIAWMLQNDHRSSSGGIQAAQTLLNWGADAVIGHFSSLAACTAVPLYLDAGIMVALPAASSPDLDRLQDRQNLLLRYQRSNTELLAYCHLLLQEVYSHDRIYYLLQDDAYGQAWQACLPMGCEVFHNVMDLPQREGALVIIGLDNFVSRCMCVLHERPPYLQVALIDDAWNTKLAQQLHLHGSEVFCLRSEVKLSSYKCEDLFWQETLLAFSAVAQYLELGTNEHLPRRSQYFDEHGIHKEAQLVLQKYMPKYGLYSVEGFR